MFGRTTLFFMIAVALIGLTWWVNPFGRGGPSGERAALQPIDYSSMSWLYPPAPAPKRDDVSPGAFTGDPIVVPDCTLNPTYTQNVPSQQDGQIAWIGTLVNEDQARALPKGQVEARELEQGGKKKTLYFRRLKESYEVELGQDVALVNPVKAIDKVDIARAKLEVTKAQQLAAEKIYNVSKKERERLEKARGRPGTTVSISDSELALATAQEEKAYQESKAKVAEITAAEKELNSALTDLNFHSLRNMIPGRSVIKTIEKKEGDSVRTGETVMQLQNTSLLRAEGLVDVSYMEKLKRNAQVRVEPSYETSHLTTLPGHRKEITSVAVLLKVGGAKNAPPEPFIISGSLDKYVFVWNLAKLRMLHALPHPEGVRCVAASPQGNLFLSACGDGSVRLWDLNKIDQPPVLLKDNPHRDAVTALAFSPDGKWFATGGADNLICLWQTDGASLVYPFDAKHGVDNPPQGQVTSLTFTPQCRLVAAGRDNALRVWELYDKAAKPAPDVGHAISDRSGTVAQLGVSSDGQYMLFDQGKTLQIMSVKGGSTEAVVKKPSTSTQFETLALFSPDGKLILTAGAADGRLQLWSTPTAARRAYEVRVFSSGERTGATCAAFAPKGVKVAGREFAVSGTREGQILIWPLPTDKEIAEAPVTGTLTLIDSSVEAGARQTRIGVEIDNSNNHLIPGKQATVVITP
jgi:WD40 repeat protein